MNFRMTKKEAVQQFRWDWSDFLKSNPNFDMQTFDNLFQAITMAKETYL